MPLPICRKLSDWEIERLFSKDIGLDIANHIHILNPKLYNLLLISKEYKQENESSAYIRAASIIYSLLSDAAKPNKLPVVSEGTVASTIASFFGNREEKSIKTYMDMCAKDETLMACIGYICDEDNMKFTYEERDCMCKAFAQFYDLLSRQYESDEMEELYG